MAYKKTKSISAEKVVDIESYVRRDRDALESKLDKFIENSGGVFVSYCGDQNGETAITAYHCQGATVAIKKYICMPTPTHQMRYAILVKIVAEKKPTGLIRKLKQAVDECVPASMRRLV